MEGGQHAFRVVCLALVSVTAVWYASCQHTRVDMKDSKDLEAT